MKLIESMQNKLGKKREKVTKEPNALRKLLMNALKCVSRSWSSYENHTLQALELRKTQTEKG